MLNAASLFACQPVEKVKLLHSQGNTVKQFYKEKLDFKIQQGIDLLKKNFENCNEMWPVVSSAMECKIKKVVAEQKAPYIASQTASCLPSSRHTVAAQELQSWGISPATVHLQFIAQNSFAYNRYNEDLNRYILSFDSYSADSLTKPHFRAAVNHEICHIKKNDEITKKFIFNMLVCGGESPGSIKHSAAWILFNHALEFRADILPLFKSDQCAQDMLSLMGTFYKNAQEEGSEHLMTPTHPSIEKRYKKMETVVACIKAEEQLKKISFTTNAFEA